MTRKTQQTLINEINSKNMFEVILFLLLGIIKGVIWAFLRDFLYNVCKTTLSKILLIYKSGFYVPDEFQVHFRSFNFGTIIDIISILQGI